MKLHRRNAVADFEGKARASIERDMFGHLTDDGGELARCHVRAVAVDHVPKLNEDFRPRFGIAAAVESGELPGFHFRDVIAGFDRAAFIREHEWRRRVPIAGLEQSANGDALSCARHQQGNIHLGNVEHWCYLLFQ